MASAASSPVARHEPASQRGGTMGWSWKLGELFGIGIYVHATFLILLAWVAVSHLAQGHGLGMAVDGLVLILAVFGIVVLHELGHALTARRFGFRTRDITLLPIGGVASLERMPEKPIQELLVALAGPAVNVVLALLLAAVIVLTHAPFVPGEMHVVGGPFLAKLLWINVSLAAFNLLPAFPMDGGRVLRAALAFRMDFAHATDVAARLGQGMALLFGIAGLMLNPMLLFIALFVWMGAQHEAALVRLRSALRGIPIQSAMITDFRTLAPDEPLARAVQLILAGFQHDFPVVGPAGLVGVLTRDDVVKGLASGGPEVPVERAMRREFATAEPSEMLEGAFDNVKKAVAAAAVLVLASVVRAETVQLRSGQVLVGDVRIADGGAIVVEARFPEVRTVTLQRGELDSCSLSRCCRS